MLLGEQQEVDCRVYDRDYKELAKKIKAASRTMNLYSLFEELLK